MTDDPHDPRVDENAENPAEGDDALEDEFDTEETELVAYLDGELDEAAARRVEAKLSQDPQARAKAAALKKTYDLLDYLPRPEPSPTFASRTLDRLPTSGTAKSSPTNNTTPAKPASGSTPLSVPSMGGLPVLTPPSRVLPWLVGSVAALALAASIGFAGHYVVRTYIAPPADASVLSLEESRLVENLPLYAGVDDFDFLVRLADSDEFTPDDDLPTTPGVTTPPALAQAAAGQPWGNDLSLAKAFKALPPARQDQLRELDRKLYSQPPAERTKLLRVLESYAVWLHGLDETERKAIFDARSPATRLAAIRDIRELRWRERLPPPHRAMLENAEPGTKRTALVQQLKTAEQDRRRNWLLARKNWETIRTGRVPWPFDSDAMRNEVSDYVRSVLKVDGNSNGRLTASEADLLRDARDFAEKNDAWLWYGSDLYHLANKYPMYPEPIGTPITRIDDLSRFPKKIVGDRKPLREAVGKWPEFALAVVEEARRSNLSLPMALGPCRPGEFRPPIESFLVKTLLPKLTREEKESLKQLEGKWPEYPKRMIELAKKHDMPVPGVTLPGSPKKWESTYQSQVPRMGPRPGN